ncbi:MAG: orotidine-5'-phosphate decarboxylase [Kiritimatiellia bacterium]|nr:orotidine-5'-phosphate decarboxylase [Kiritimatiellia bacterium]
MTPELIVALDVPDRSAIGPLVDSLPPEIRWYKIGLEAFAAEGPAALEPLRSRGKNIFLDLKLHDIPRTVERAVRAAAAHGAGLVTVHASGGRAMLEAAVKAAREAGENRPRLLAVTLLTSLDAGDLAELGVTRSPGDQIEALARLAIDSGIDGLVCSVHEVGALRRKLGPGPLLVTPGIRLPGGEVGDQKRIGTPAEAARAGATHLVVGRPVLDAPDPAAAARKMLEALSWPPTQGR